VRIEACWVGALAVAMAAMAAMADRRHATGSPGPSTDPSGCWAPRSPASPPYAMDKVEQLDAERLMLVPGFLLPAEREDLIHTADGLTEVDIPRPFGP
jgi:hypothetical protein